MAGRSDPEALLRPIEASDVARERLKILLLTLGGPWRVKDALDRLSISRTRFQTLRRRMLEAALAALEPQPVGRPPRVREAQDLEVLSLRHRVLELTRELRIVQTSLDLAEGAAAGAVRRRVRQKLEQRGRRR